MRVVVDTNVLVSAVLRNREPNVVIRFIMADPNTEWIASTEILEEYREVLSRPKFKLPTAVLEGWHGVLDDHVVLVPVTVEIDLQRDRKDAKFFSCAASAGAPKDARWRVLVNETVEADAYDAARAHAAALRDLIEILPDG